MTLIAALPYRKADSKAEELDGLVLASDRANIDINSGNVERCQKIHILFDKKVAFGASDSSYTCYDGTVMSWSDGFVRALVSQPFDYDRIQKILYSGLEYHFGLYIDQLKFRGINTSDLNPSRAAFWFMHHNKLREYFFHLNPKNLNITMEKKTFKAAGSITAFGNDFVSDVVSKGPSSKYWQDFLNADHENCLQKFVEGYLHDKIDLESQIQSLNYLSRASYFYSLEKKKEISKRTQIHPLDWINLQFVGRTVDIVIVNSDGCFFDA